MTFTVWSNAGKFEWICWMGETVLDRSGLVYNSYKAAMRSAMKAAQEYRG